MYPHKCILKNEKGEINSSYIISILLIIIVLLGAILGFRILFDNKSNSSKSDEKTLEASESNYDITEKTDIPNSNYSSNSSSISNSNSKSTSSSNSNSNSKSTSSSNSNSNSKSTSSSNSNSNSNSKSIPDEEFNYIENKSSQAKESLSVKSAKEKANLDLTSIVYEYYSKNGNSSSTSLSEYIKSNFKSSDKSMYTFNGSEIQIVGSNVTGTINQDGQIIWSE